LPVVNADLILALVALIVFTSGIAGSAVICATA
jgi:hypothetical protein